MDEHISDLERTLSANPGDHSARAELIGTHRRAGRHHEANVLALDLHYARAHYLPSADPFTFLDRELHLFDLDLGPCEFEANPIRESIKLTTCVALTPPRELYANLREMLILLPLLEHEFGPSSQEASSMQTYFRWPFRDRQLIEKWAQVAHYLKNNYVQPED